MWHREDRDLANIAESRAWAIGARALLRDGTEARVQAIGPDRVLGNHCEPTAVCSGAIYLVRELRAIDPLHPRQLVLPV